MKFEFNLDRPIYIQLVEQLKMYIITGKLPLNSRLPSVRDLANMAKVNPNTMQKALIELEDIGLIYTERTNGKYVTNDEKRLINIKEDYAKALSDDYLKEMLKLGFSKEDAIKKLKGEK